MKTTTVWAWQPLPELRNQTGFVECEIELAEMLMKSGRAQDPRDGATALKHITTDAAPAPLPPPAPAHTRDEDEARDPVYQTKVMSPKKPPKPK